MPLLGSGLLLARRIAGSRPATPDATAGGAILLRRRIASNRQAPCQCNLGAL
jgi:hypothetical protein